MRFRGALFSDKPFAYTPLHVHSQIHWASCNVETQEEGIRMPTHLTKLGRIVKSNWLLFSMFQNAFWMGRSIMGISWIPSRDDIYETTVILWGLKMGDMPAWWHFSQGKWWLTQDLWVSFWQNHILMDFSCGNMGMWARMGTCQHVCSPSKPGSQTLKLNPTDGNDLTSRDWTWSSKKHI